MGLNCFREWITWSKEALYTATSQLEMFLVCNSILLYLLASNMVWATHTYYTSLTILHYFLIVRFPDFKSFYCFRLIVDISVCWCCTIFNQIGLPTELKPSLKMSGLAQQPLKLYIIPCCMFLWTLLVQNSSCVKITDFGLAKLLNNEEAIHSTGGKVVIFLTILIKCDKIIAIL